MKRNCTLMNLFLHFSLFLIRPLLPLTVAVIYSNSSSIISDGDSITKPGCPSKCGSLIVPYPFGIGINTGCSINHFFDINCNTSFNPPRAFIGIDELEVVGIYNTKIHVKNRVVSACPFIYWNWTDFSSFQSFHLSGTPFSFSIENKFTVVGCKFTAYIFPYFGGAWIGGALISLCMTYCNKSQDIGNGFCSGIGCCHASIPKGLQDISMYVGGFANSHTWSYNTCGYAFFAEHNSYSFHVSDISADLTVVHRIIETVPLSIDWEIGHKNCSMVQSMTGIICHGESACVDSGTGLGGYRCNCSQGYHGNPYLSPGCQDINECESYPCHENATCSNLPGTYNCSCNNGYIGDGLKECTFLPRPTKKLLYAGLGMGVVSFSTLLFSFWLYKLLKKSRLDKLKQNLFKRNGGLLLKQQMSAHEKMRIFTAEELERATDGFNQSHILGQGGQGTVYKGMLLDGRVIAVKKSRKIDEKQLDVFINEVLIMSQIKHRNIVKLLGCCLETEVPLLVFEFIPCGTLSNLIHDCDSAFPFSWDVRLRIASEVANGLAYLHYSAPTPIYHRDMKSSNILVDDKCTAKISDFGLSRSIAIHQTHLTTKVAGTFGYVDPEYLQTSKFTEKSDVYSFGVVLIELLTGQKPISTTMTDEESSLVERYLLTMNEDQLKSILDPRISEQAVREDQFLLANLAKRCLNSNGRKRPNMRDIAMELESIITF